MLSCQCVALKRNCRCHGAWNLQRHAAVREVSVEMHKVPCHKLSHWINNKVIEGKIVFFNACNGVFLWQMAMAGWQGGSRKHASISFCSTTKRPRCVGLHFKMPRNDSKCCLVSALCEGCEQRIIVFCLLWITSKNMQLIEIDRNGYE